MSLTPDHSLYLHSCPYISEWFVADLSKVGVPEVQYMFGWPSWHSWCPWFVYCDCTCWLKSLFHFVQCLSFTISFSFMCLVILLIPFFFPKNYVFLIQNEMPHFTVYQKQWTGKIIQYKNKLYIFDLEVHTPNSLCFF
jgi:hypothetical protein